MNGQDGQINSRVDDENGNIESINRQVGKRRNFNYLQLGGKWFNKLIEKKINNWKDCMLVRLLQDKYKKCKKY